jgi:hypothetical protein
MYNNERRKATMKYPSHTVTKPLSGKQAEIVRDAIKTGKPITNAEYEATLRSMASEGYFGKKDEAHAGKVHQD